MKLNTFLIAIGMSIAPLLTAADSMGGELMFDPLPATTLSPRKVTARLTSSNLVVSWTGEGILQEASQIDGPWLNVAVGTPFRVVPQGMRFYRVLSATRPTRIYVPPQYKPGVPLPLVISLHAYGSNAQSQENALPLRGFADSAGFLYCVPQGIADGSGAPQWNGNDACTSPSNDVAWLTAVITGARQALAVDTNRVYLVGISNGGIMAYRIACERADYIAGIVSISGATWGQPIKCQPASLLHVLEVHGTADTVISYNGGTFCGSPYLGARQGIMKWGAFNGCQSPEEESDKTMDLDLGVPGLDSRVTRMTNCTSAAVVELWTIVGGGHIPTTRVRTEQSELPRRVVDWLLAHPKP